MASGVFSASFWSPRRVDAALVIAATTLGVGNSWIKPSNGLLLTGAPLPLTATVSGAVGLLLWWRRRHPFAVGCLVVLCHLLCFTPTALAIALYTVGTACRRQARVLAFFVIVASVADIGTLWSGGAWDPREAGYTLALAIGPLAVGGAVGLRRDLTTAAQAQLATLEREQELLVQRTRVEERSRIARDMHDVVAHRVGHIVLTAGALRVGAAAHEPKIADAAELIRREGRHALEELREILGILTPGRRAPRAPRPDADELSGLVERCRRTGQLISLCVEGFPEALPTVVQQALYRTLQEALTNAAKHAPGASVDVDLHCRVDGVHLTVSNGPATRSPDDDLPSGGHGLVGLRERAALLGGHIDAAPSADGFRVALHLPSRPSTE
ncbi:histidine kinase [Streptomyces sp. NPDC052207]|uniref:sensor histidine kinase n=1 Tax=Streptomyces sp. NPDC052207 TaxID=3155418 RepID=UPI00342B7FA5